MQKMFQRSALLRPFLQLHLSFQQCQIFVLLLAVSGQLGWFNYFNKVDKSDRNNLAFLWTKKLRFCKWFFQRLFEQRPDCSLQPGSLRLVTSQTKIPWRLRHPSSSSFQCQRQHLRIRPQHHHHRQHRHQRLYLKNAWMTCLSNILSRKRMLYYYFVI